MNTVFASGDLPENVKNESASEEETQVGTSQSGEIAGDEKEPTETKADIENADKENAAKAEADEEDLAGAESEKQESAEENKETDEMLDGASGSGVPADESKENASEAESQKASADHPAALSGPDEIDPDVTCAMYEIEGARNPSSPLAFTPSASGIYEFRSYGSYAASILISDSEGNKIGNAFDNLLTGHYRLAVELMEGETYSIALNDTRKTGTYQLRVSRTFIPSEFVSLEYQLNMPDYMDNMLFSFTPEMGGEFLFESENGTDPFLSIIDEGGREVASDDDSGEGSNFLVKCNLTAGKKYYVMIMNYGASETGILRIRKGYTIRLDAKGGRLEKDTMVVYGGMNQIGELPVPVRENYTFDGWYRDLARREPVTAESRFYSNTSIYASWKLALPCPFTDVAPEKYYFEPVLWAYERDIVKGTDATHFSPDQICSRGQVVTFLWRALGSPEPHTTTNPFVDISHTSPFYDAVLWAYENNITMGRDATHFGTDQPVTRSQFVTFLWRCEGSPMWNFSNPFEDVPDTMDSNAILWAYARGITRGVDDTHFMPQQVCTRAQVTSFIYRNYYND